MQNSYLGTRVFLQNGSYLTAVSISHVKRSRTYYIWECSKCSADTELWPQGSIVTCRYDVAKYVPCGCSFSPAYTPEQMEIRAARFAREVDAYFICWAEPYRGNATKCLLFCNAHGPWMTGGFNDLKRKRGCPTCGAAKRALNKRLTLESCEKRIALDLFAVPWKYAGLSEKFKGGNTRIFLKCEKHGKFETTFHYAHQGNTGCMECAVSGFGFDQTKPAHLYALVSDCEGYIKIGVSNNLPKRTAQLKSTTPFPFRVYGTWAAGGTEVLRKERWFHRTFESAGLSGFDGYSEWLKSNPEILIAFTKLDQGYGQVMP